VTVRLDYDETGVLLTVRTETGPVATETGPVASEAGGPVATGTRDFAGGAPAGGAVTTESSPVTVRTANAGYGLTSMRERLRMTGGTLEAGPGNGCWVVTAQVPLPPAG
jgi:hypothetical protein